MFVCISANNAQWICGAIPSLPGFVAYVNTSVQIPIGLTHLYYICFLSGMSISAAVYCMLHFLFPVPAVESFVTMAPPAATLMLEYRERWDRGDEVETDFTETTKL